MADFQRKTDAQQPKALPPYKPDYPKWAAIGIAALVIIGIMVFMFPVKAPGPLPGPSLQASPTPAVTFAPSPSASPIVSEEPIPVVTLKEVSRCGNLPKDITLQNDILVDGTCFTVEAEGVTIDCAGFSLEGTRKQNSTGISSQFKGTHIKNCQISNFEIGARLRWADGSSIDDSTFSNNIGGAVLENSAFIDARRNKFFNNSEVAVLLTLVLNSTLEENFIDNNKKWGVHLFGSDGNALKGNYIYRNAFGLQVAKSDFNLIEGNNVSFNSAGIKVLEGSTQNLFLSNFVSSNRGIGIHVLDSYGNIFRKNTILKNEYGANFYNTYGIVEGNYVCDNTIEDFECRLEQQNATGNTCFLRAIACGFDCAARCPGK